MASPLRPRPLPWRDKRGFASVEFTAVAPVLFFVMMACVDFGRAISQTMEFSHAARAGAQYAVTAPNDRTRITETVQNALPSHLRTSPTVITSTCHCGALPSGNSGLPPVAECDSACPAGSARMMKIRVERPFQPYNFAFGQMIANTVGFSQVSSDVTIRNQ